jgi:hypothetical protein
MIFNCFVIDQLKSLSDKYKNDYELGSKVRILFSNDINIINSPNDYKLGELVRKEINKQV